MALALDPTYFPAIAHWIPLLQSRPVPKLHEHLVIRSNVDALFGEASKRLGYPEDVVQDVLKFKSFDGEEIEIMWTRIKSPSEAESSSAQPAIVHAHGGGMIAGSIHSFGTGIAFNCSATRRTIMSVNYRKAPEHPYPIPIEDMFAGLQWVQANAAKFNIDPARLAIMGESAGGGLAAGVALLAKDRKLSPPLARQIIIYPMIDDSNLTPLPALEPFATWNNVSNITGWTAYLGPKRVGCAPGTKSADGKEDLVPIYAAPIRATVEQLKGLPRTYMDVGELDLFKVEDMTYAMRMATADVPLEFHLYPGLPHAFEGLAPEIEASKVARANRWRVMQDF